MRIDDKIGVNQRDPWMERLSEDSRAAPFNAILKAMNSSLSGQRYEASSAEGQMTKWGALGVVSAGIAVAVHFSGQSEIAAIFGLGSLASAFRFALALGLRRAYLSEAAIVEEHLINAGFKLAWSRDSMSSQWPVIVTLEWPGR